MSRKYEIGVADPLNDIASAIADYYGVGNYTIHYQTTTDLIFEVPSVFNKVIRMGSRGTLYYGDAWTSGTTITNQQTVCSDASSNVLNYLILSTYAIKYFIAAVNATYQIIGSLNNDEYVCIAFCSDSHLDQNMYPKRISDNTILTLYVLCSTRLDLKTSENKILKYPLYFTDADGYIISDTNGNPAYLRDTMLCGITSNIFNDDYLFISFYSYRFLINPAVILAYSSVIDDNLDNYTL